MFSKVDAVRIRVKNIDEALEFYEKALGHGLVWRRGKDSAAVRLRDSDTEIVFVHDEIKPEVNFLVDSVEESVRRFEGAGGMVVAPPFDIQIGKCAVVRDQWGNELVMVDTSKGLLKTDASGNVVGP